TTYLVEEQGAKKSPDVWCRGCKDTESGGRTSRERVRSLDRATVLQAVRRAIRGNPISTIPNRVCGISSSDPILDSESPAAAVATSREGQRSLRSGQEVQHRRWGRGQHLI